MTLKFLFYTFGNFAVKMPILTFECSECSKHSEVVRVHSSLKNRRVRTSFKVLLDAGRWHSEKPKNVTFRVFLGAKSDFRHSRIQNF